MSAGADWLKLICQLDDGERSVVYVLQLEESSSITKKKKKRITDYAVKRLVDFISNFESMFRETQLGRLDVQNRTSVLARLAHTAALSMCGRKGVS